MIIAMEGDVLSKRPHCLLERKLIADSKWFSYIRYKCWGKCFVHCTASVNTWFFQICSTFTKVKSDQKWSIEVISVLELHSLPFPVLIEFIRVVGDQLFSPTLFPIDKMLQASRYFMAISYRDIVLSSTNSNRHS